MAPYVGFRVAPPAVSRRQWVFLAARFRRAVRKQPEIAMLRRRLRAMGGEMLVPAPDDVEEDISELLDKAEVMTGRVILRQMEASGCHQNVARLWLHGLEGLTASCTGYAHSEDALWRQHSWGCCPDGIIETTTPRLLYWGVSYRHANADAFAKGALGTPTYWAVRLSRWRPFR